MPTDYHAFVDESGDDGFSQSSTDWLVVSAVIIHLPSSLELAAKWNECREYVHREPGDRLHWKKLDHPAKKALLQRMESINFSIVAVAAHKRSLTAAEALRLKCPTLYCFITKFLTERLTWFARDNGSKINVTFEDRPQVNFSSLKDYVLSTLKVAGMNTQIDHERLNGFNCKHHSQEKRLEIADSVASAIGSGLNADRYGGVETSYAVSLLPRFWERKGNLYSYGMKTIPNIDRSKFKLFREFDAAKGLNKKAPG
ncbi:MAG: DUF3800 domain-containing protein [Candidatus Acidiferrales bacterium]